MIIFPWLDKDRIVPSNLIFEDEGNHLVWILEWNNQI